MDDATCQKNILSQFLGKTMSQVNPDELFF